MPDEEEFSPDEAAPFWGFWHWLVRTLFGSKQSPLTDPSDIVPPGARPICPRCVQSYEPVLPYCPHCDEPVGTYKALVYPDLIWIWGRALWRLMDWNKASRLVWAGMVLLAIDWLCGTYSPLLPFYEEGLGWLARPMTSIWLALLLISVVAGIRMLAKARRLWGTWPGSGQASMVNAASEGCQAGDDED